MTDKRKTKKLDGLEFYVPLWRDKIKHYNIFNSFRVRVALAYYLTGKWKMPTEDREGLFRTPLEQWALYCFGDMWSRYEYEVGLGEYTEEGEARYKDNAYGEPFSHDDGTWTATKSDMFQLFILPNAKLLKQMVDEVSVSSAWKFLEEMIRPQERRQHV